MADHANHAAAPVAAAAAMAEGMIAMQRHLLDFAAMRIRSDLDAAAEMAGCREAPRLAELAQGFCAKAMADYAEEAQALMRMSAAVAAEAAAKARPKV